ncbi:ABC transporter ATP-binding protein [Streptomyces sp. CA2R101]|uniref:ABC transporter ATP-binding protein n=1 Tax=Streptomyces sp. CA2R101 TaxID=3120152 RepID=UPI00300B13B5
MGLLWLGGFALSAAIGGYGAKRALWQTAMLVEPLRDDLVARTAEASLLQAVERSSGNQDLSGVARLTRQVEIVREASGTMISVMGRFTFTVIGVCVGTLTLDTMAAALIFTPVITAVICYALSLRKVARAQLRDVVASEQLAQEAWEVSAGLRDVTACGMEDAAFRRVAGAARENAQIEVLLARLNALRTMALGVSGWLPLILVLAWARWGNAQMSAGTVLGLLTYVAQSLRPAVQALVQGLGTTGVRLFVTVGRLLQAPVRESDAKGGMEGDEPDCHLRAVQNDRDEGPLNSAGKGGELTLRKVSFAYVPGANDVLVDVDLRISPGEHLAVVGPSGIGKSTLAAIMAGTRRPTRGQVFLEGVELGSLPAERWAASRVYLPQEAYVFTGTLRENLTYLGDAGGGADRLNGAVHDLGLANLLKRVGGYDSVVDPESLSAGERQLIALTRAYLAPARLRILDEATCHLDPAAEARAERALRRRPGTLVVIAHRISSALLADRVMVMDGQRAVIGRHDDVLAASPLYRDLVGLWAPDTSPGARSAAT